MEEFNLSKKIGKITGIENIPNEIIDNEPFIKIIHIKEFIKMDWVLTNHFFWDLFRKWEIDEDEIEKVLTELLKKKNKLAGDKLI